MPLTGSKNTALCGLKLGGLLVRKKITTTASPLGQVANPIETESQLNWKKTKILEHVAYDKSRLSEPTVANYNKENELEYCENSRRVGT